MAANIQNELTGIDLGDVRRNGRIGKLAARMAANPRESVRSACKGWAEAIAGFRLLHNKAVTPEKILAAHEEATMVRAGERKRLLLIQDTTELDYTSHKALQGVGRLDAENRQGFYVHGNLIADEDAGVALGLCDTHIWTRDMETKKQGHRDVVFENKESYRWFEGYLRGCSLAASLPQSEVLVVADRESDIYEIYAERQKLAEQGAPHAHVLVRAARDRILLDSEPHLFDAMRQGRALGTYTVEFASKEQTRKVAGVTQKIHRKKRKAKLQVRSTRVILKPPPRKFGEPLVPVELWAVGVFEVDPPKGQEPIEWFLLTSLPAQTFKQARRIIRAYEQRWLIEEFHRILKSGCRVEHVNFRDKDSLLPTVALYLIVAWRILYLRDFRRAQPHLPCSIFFTTAEWHAACIIERRPIGGDLPTLAEMVDMVGKMGGHMGRKTDPSPGPECLWRGMEKLRCYVEMGTALGRL